MKYLKKFFESSEELKSDILENFIFISDKFGNPTITNSKWGSSYKYSLSWNIKIDFSHFQESNYFIKKIKNISDDIDDIITAGKRLNDYNINIALDGNYLKIDLIPKERYNDNYNFILGYHFRELRIDVNEIERFFTKFGTMVTKIDVNSSYDSYSERNDMEIYLSKNDGIEDFSNTFKQELENKIDQIDREYDIITGRNKVIIASIDEKSYISPYIKE